MPSCHGVSDGEFVFIVMGLRLSLRLSRSGCIGQMLSDNNRGHKGTL